MKNSGFTLIFALLFVGCVSKSPDCPPCEAAQAKEVEVTRQVETVKEVEVTRQVETVKEVEVTRVVVVTAEGPANEVGPWTIQQTITQVGQYLVPDEMQPGQWSYKADDPKDTCWATTNSDLSGSSDSTLDNFYSENKGFFVLKPNVKMIVLQFGPCTWTRIGE